MHLAVGKPLRPVPWSSSIIFKLPPGFGVRSLYPRIAIRCPTLSKRKLERSFFEAGGAQIYPKTNSFLGGLELLSSNQSLQHRYLQAY